MGGMRLAAAAAAVCWVAAPSTAHAAGSAAANLARLNEMLEAAKKDDCKTVLGRARTLLDHHRGSGLPPELAPFAFEVAAWCKVEQGNKAAALDYAVRGTEFEQSSDSLWQLRLGLQGDTKQYEAAVVTVEAMSQGRGAALNGDSRTVSMVYNIVRDSGREDLRRRLLKILASDAYAPESMGPDDYFRYDYAVMLIEAGDKERARPLVAALREPNTLIKASLDGRVRSLLAAEPDVRAAAEAMLAFHREAAARFPDRLGPLVDAAEDLRLLGRPREAVDLLRSAAPRIADSNAFEDRDARLNWWWNALAYSYAAAGDYDEAVSAFRHGAAAGESGGVNVSQVINLASMQVDHGHGADALKTLAVFDDPKVQASPYGLMQMHRTRGCAYAAEHRLEAAAADLAYVKAHDKDSPGSLADLLLCLGDVDGAAAAYIRRLDDPKLRTAALVDLSDYDDPPFASPDPTAAEFAALRGRADVKAAIARAGGTRRFHVQRI
jgi:tetratricopeptide (TPR) repeat protein